MRKTETSLGTASGLHITMILLGIAMTPVLLSSSSLGNQLLEGQLISVVALGELSWPSSLPSPSAWEKRPDYQPMA